MVAGLNRSVAHSITRSELGDRCKNIFGSALIYTKGRPMSIRRQDLSVLLLYCLGYSRIRNLILRLQHEPVARLVTFHDLQPEALGYFEANLRFLKRSTNVVSLNEFFSGRLSTDKINVVITFDDGYKSWIAYAVPLLKKLRLPATFFISSGFVGLSKENEAEFMRSKLLLTPDPRRVMGGLTCEDVRRLVEEGFTVGGHTLNHCNVAELQDSIQIRYEIAEDKLRLEKMIGRTIDYFAYPFGAYQNPEIDITEILSDSGYKGAVTTISGFNRVSTSPYLLHRELTYASMTGCIFRARVYGNYDAVQFLKQQINKIIQREGDGIA
jgi:peptidoglycan/xylan/chitin deacetylase (PgdA/CDA1 family)